MQDSLKLPVEVVTIVNSSGKIISSGKHLLGVFKEAKATYDQKKASVKAERAVERAIKRSQTFDVAALPQYREEVDYGRHSLEYRQTYHDDDDASQASSRRSHGSKFSRGSRKSRASTLTENNLRAHSEVSATAPSHPPAAYRSPYAETAPRDMALSRPTLARAPTAPAQSQAPMPIYYEDEVLDPYQEPAAVMVRPRSNPSMKKKEIDMDLAYGDAPPDLVDMVHLDPAHQAREADDAERKAHELAEKIEDLLNEAECMHHTATHIIDHLQNNPDAAAAVALLLAELSAIVGKLSPSFLGILKGGSPAVFGLLASPQFLIAAGVTVGVTVVMFGGFKIIKRIKEEQAARALAAQPMAFEAQPAQRMPQPEYDGQGFDEALVLEEELSTIETWRRGIPPGSGDEAADLELISPEADRAIRSQYGGDDGRTVRSGRTHRSSKTSKSHKSSSHKSHKGLRSRSAESHDRRSTKNRDRDEASEAGSHRSHRSHRSERTERSTKSSSKSSTRHEVRAVDDRDTTVSMAIRPKKDNLLKSIFKKKKENDDHHEKKARSTVAYA
ncbi:hypothetical protein DL766_005291 [Monosporascus sp. MC13-8B]|uniref:Uncharacterized protein n=1 Tax=Monosporascus cannonballus TaxID=155416 RepID=A0ABY0GSB2_9PEZI|nr:hypothetical protein DL762_010029 [Monosporascus cannonballus]RYO76786.1 hypothetical protein DL763_010173 [Monosporascus cannonballus]RYP29558.1 hypothetical protein DL766_005291 [Monosporascus sp. MC13-8B]